jgi:hypothetical protein
VEVEVAAAVIAEELAAAIVVVAVLVAVVQKASVTLGDKGDKARCLYVQFGNSFPCFPVFSDCNEAVFQT